MAFRGRGGFGRGGFGRAKEEPFVLFPDINLPDVSDVLSSLSNKKKNNEEEILLIKESLGWLEETTEYYLDQTAGKDKRRKGNREINSFSQYLVPSLFPRELTRGSNVREVSRDKVEWDRKKEEMYLDRIEKMEQERDAKEKMKPEKGEDEGDGDGDGDEEDEEDEFEFDDDYTEHLKADDDEDDYNDEEEGADEPELEL